MASTRKRSSVDEWTADTWYREFFGQCRLPDDDAKSYAVIFARNGMQSDMLKLLDKELLKEMKILKVGHIIKILQVAQEVSSQEQRSEITQVPKGPISTIQSKVVSLKSMANNTKDFRTRREGEVGGLKRDITTLKRPVPDEGPTLSVKMPTKMRPDAPKNIEVESIVPQRTGNKDRTSAQSVEVSSSTEKKLKKSVFDRLGTISTSQPSLASSSTRPVVQSTVQAMPSPGILKKAQNKQNPKLYGPALRRSASPKEARRCQSPGRLVLTNSSKGSILLQNSQSASSLSPYRPRSGSPNQLASVKPSTSVEPSFHVIISKELSNPLVTKISNGPLNKRQQERKNSIPSSPNYSRSTPSASSANDKQYYGSMAADKVEMYKDFGYDRALKMRLGNRANSWNKIEGSAEKKRVSFGNVRTQEIPAVPGTQPLNTTPTLLCKQIYSGSVALRTAKKL